ncbi:hypothetical protein [Levilactobacillus suantsaii]|uniref:YolD-like family protein n=1 Tax=Levilactobacillus suantsaii TaxID=2292255 RepID=A0A4Q0VH75_9LACO|nr:hypothetical protein [Levilactobacillus suantsaii]QMU08837.1 hypothetical protein H3M12_04050 [Levilactobacillus suantsaii]RXI76135.1 hypothetical protein DXH47_10925 [Levilactobacillus suantsaii]
MSRDSKRKLAEQLFNDTSAYRDIMGHPRPVSKNHPQMTPAERAAQFAPFAALSGYTELLDQSAQTVRDRAELPAELAAACHRQLRALQPVLAQRPWVEATYFDPETGASHTATVRIKAITSQAVILTTGQEIPRTTLQAIHRCDPPKL